MDVRHRGRHRVQDVDRGRHRSVGLEQAAIPPLLVASGAVAAAALTAIVLSGAAGPLGQLFGERADEPRPSTAAAGPRGGPPTAADIVALTRGYAPGAGGMGSSWGPSAWEVLFHQEPGKAGSVLATLCDEARAPWPLTAASGSWQTISLAAVQPGTNGMPTATAGMLTGTTTAPSAPGGDGSVPAGTTQQAPGADPGTGPSGSGTDDAAAGDLAPVTTATEPVTGSVGGAVEPVVQAVPAAPVPPPAAPAPVPPPAAPAPVPPRAAPEPVAAAVPRAPVAAPAPAQPPREPVRKPVPEVTEVTKVVEPSVPERLAPPEVPSTDDAASLSEDVND